MYLDAQKPKSSHTNVCSKWENTNRDTAYLKVLTLYKCTRL